MNTTEWFDPETSPVYVGDYEIELLGSLPTSWSPPIKARWERRHGQLGFWTREKVEDSQGSHVVSSLVSVRRWRGLTRPMITEEARCRLDAMITIGTINRCAITNTVTTTMGSRAIIKNSILKL